jgi:hypothetical protein
MHTRDDCIATERIVFLVLLCYKRVSLNSHSLVPELTGNVEVGNYRVASRKWG